MAPKTNPLNLLKDQDTQAMRDNRRPVSIVLQVESLILAQNERWRRALHMQVERESPFGGE